MRTLVAQNQYETAEKNLRSLEQYCNEKALNSVLTELYDVAQWFYSIIGDFGKAINADEKCIKVIDEVGDIFRKNEIQSRFSWTLIQLGHWEKARKTLQENILLSRQIKNESVEGWGYWYLASIDVYSGHITQQTIELLDTAKEIGDQLPEYWLGVDARTFLVRVYLELSKDNNYDYLKKLIYEAEKICEAHNLLQGTIRCLSLKAEVDCNEGNISAAHDSVQEAIAIMNRIKHGDLLLAVRQN